MEELTEKHEVTIGLTADEIARRNFEAERRLGEWRREHGYRVEDVQDGSSLLLGEVREDTGREQGDNPLGAVASSDTISESSEDVSVHNSPES